MKIKWTADKVYCRSCKYHWQDADGWGPPCCRAFATRCDSAVSWYLSYEKCEDVNVNNNCDSWEERMTVSKRFFKAVDDMRYGIKKGLEEYNHKRLDTIVQIVVEEDINMGEPTLQDDVTRIIKRIKEEKENEQTREKADELIEKIKEEL